MSTPTLTPGDGLGLGHRDRVGDARAVVVRDGQVRLRVLAQRLPDGTTTSPSRARKVTFAPAAEIWSMVRFDGVPFHHLLSGTPVSAKRARRRRTGRRRRRSCPRWCSNWNSPSACSSEQLVVAARGHLLAAVVAVLVDVPDGEALVGQLRVAAGLAPVLDQEVLPAAAGVHREVVGAGGQRDLGAMGERGHGVGPARQPLQVARRSAPGSSGSGCRPRT